MAEGAAEEGVLCAKVMTDEQMEVLRSQISAYATICEQLVEMHRTTTAQQDSLSGPLSVLVLLLLHMADSGALGLLERGRVICSLINHLEVPRSLQSSVGHQPLCRYGFLRAYSTMAMELQASKGSKRSLLSSHNMAKFPRPTSITGFRTEGHVRKGSRHLQHRAILNLKPRRNPRARRKPRKEMHLHDSRKFSGGSDEMTVCASTDILCYDLQDKRT
ncbi:unnamed protein product [Musa acuminata var. zebrina]